jgi:hypothetical protein
MPVKQRTPKARRLTSEQRFDLIFGEWAKGFHTDAERRDAWFRYRDELMQNCKPGVRPSGWWSYEAPFPRPLDSSDAKRLLYEAGLLSDEEIAAVTKRWRAEFDWANKPGFAFTAAPSQLIFGAPARRAHYRWAAIPRSLVAKWTAERARNAKTIQVLRRNAEVAS